MPLFGHALLAIVAGPVLWLGGALCFDAVHALLTHALHELERARVDAIEATGLCRRYHPVMLDLGFVRHPSTSFALTVNLAARGTDVDLGTEDDWYLSAGDGDQLYGVTL